ncbi:hypothetical protein CDL15_Pgr008126 [Punica granatum]|uniref:STAS domain-containing protein n=1 Tax=Punica granatum TaxID=22663 RepID=A0A218VTC6_PUNGR|nr:hypothetical protein CDL15_Pgr008126 [Punica granatum]
MIEPAANGPPSHEPSDTVPYVHKVGIPPKEELLKEFKLGVKETFFVDDPLQQVKDRPRHYNLQKFKGDIVGGLTIASLSIPQDVAYAKLAKLDPQYGLDSSFAPPLIYAFMASHSLQHSLLEPLKPLSDSLAPLLSVIISTFLVYITRADEHGVAITNFVSEIRKSPFLKVKHIKKGFNPSSAKEIFFPGDYLAKGFKIGVALGMVTLTEAAAIARTFVAMKDYQIARNKEMVALGSMNMIGSLTSCYITTGKKISRVWNSLTNRCGIFLPINCELYVGLLNSGLKHCYVNYCFTDTLILITPLFKYTPNTILASIIISAVVGPVDINAMILIWKIDKFDFLACLGAFLGVVFASVAIGLLIAVSISFAKIFFQVTRLRTAILGKLPRTRWNAAIYFSNSNYVKERILRWLANEEESLKEKNQSKIEFLIIETSSVMDIDTSGIHALEELHTELLKRKIFGLASLLEFKEILLTSSARRCTSV